MKVLYIANIPSPYAMKFFNELGKLCELTVLIQRRKAADRDESWYRSETQAAQIKYLNGLRIGAEGAFCPSVVFYLEKIKNDFVIINDYSTPTCILAILWLKLRHRPFYLSVDGGMAKSGTGVLEKIKSILIGSASGWFSSSSVTDDYLLQYGAKREEIYRYPFTSLTANAIDTEVSSPEEKQRLRAKLGMTDEKIVLSVGQLIHRKGYDVLLKSVKELPDNVGIYIVGGTPTLEYTSYVADNNLKQVHFVGFKTEEQLAEYYQAADVFVLPTREDIWGLVINEAMAYGLPVITTDRCVAGLELVKDGENGFLVSAGDTNQLADKMNVILSDYSQRQAMARKSLAKIQGYTIEKMANSFNDVLVRKLRGTK